ncbi:MAG: cytochrome b/b6 domain-containing protein [Betaproteobacteria bacterium]|nr:cytochrome b/b6 domain-containing protein [Betaproteobacteria bacterium]
MSLYKNNPIIPFSIRITHWINAIAVIVMIMSGLRIYNASPIFGFKIPIIFTLGNWLGGAILWHFAFMWLLVINGLFYLITNIFFGRIWKTLLPIKILDVLRDLNSLVTFRLQHNDLTKYNTIQKIAYLSVIFDLVILVLSGLVVWKSVQFPLLRDLMGGFDQARIIHFLAMLYASLFLIIHLIMVVLVPKTLLIMTLGRAHE